MSISINNQTSVKHSYWPLRAEATLYIAHSDYSRDTAAAVVENNGVRIACVTEKIPAPNVNVGELQGIVLALKQIPDDAAEIQLFCDNQTAVNWMNGSLGISSYNPAKAVYYYARRLIAKKTKAGCKVKINWCPREQNIVADAVCMADPTAKMGPLSALGFVG